MKFFSRFSRLMRINYVVWRYNLDSYILKLPWFFPVRFLGLFNPYYWLLKNKLTRGERLRLALENLGPIFVKAGQILSTRADLLPDDIALELSKLQDQVPPFPGIIAKKIIEQSLQCPLENVFRDFDLTPLASASIAQVHKATLLNGREVVVKVLRPNIKNVIHDDIDLLTILANSSEKYLSRTKAFKPKELVSEIAETLYNELDLLREGANASQLRRNFQNSNLLYVPEIFWAYSRHNVLVMERVIGIPIHAIANLAAAGINMKRLAERGIELFFTQVFRDSFFHADMHPGNIFVALHNNEEPKYIAVDFGIMGSLSSKDQRYIAENLQAFFKRNYKRVAELHIESGWLPPNARIDQFEGSIRAICEPIFEKPLKEISFGQLLLQLFKLARVYHINIQPQLLLLQKTLVNIEGVGRQIYPDLDLWATASPVIEKWLKRQLGVRAFISRVRENLPYWSEKMPDVPLLAYEVLNEIRQKQTEERMLREIQRVKPIKSIEKNKRFFCFGIGTAFLISSISILLFQPTANILFIWMLISICFFIVGVLV